jgi:transcriptional regulator with XRE-family HTH domain
MFDVLGRIDELREVHCWSILQVAQISGIPKSTLDTWYSKRIDPPIEAIEQICIAFNISLSDFFDRKPKLQTETNLAKYRKKAGLSQLELANKSGLSTETICSYEQRKRDIKKAQYCTVERLAQILGCSTQELVK